MLSSEILGLTQPEFVLEMAYNTLTFHVPVFYKTKSATGHSNWRATYKLEELEFIEVIAIWRC